MKYYFLLLVVIIFSCSDKINYYSDSNSSSSSSSSSSSITSALNIPVGLNAVYTRTSTGSSVIYGNIQITWGGVINANSYTVQSKLRAIEYDGSTWITFYNSDWVQLTNVSANGFIQTFNFSRSHYESYFYVYYIVKATALGFIDSDYSSEYICTIYYDGN